VNHEFWHERWRDGQIAFNQQQPNALLVKHASVLKGTRVFVPLCGKTIDLVWLAARGHSVVGVELSELAVRAFFDEQSIPVGESTLGAFKRFCSQPDDGAAGSIELLCGDFFALEAEHVASDAVYDRAALIALPEPMRKQYAAHLATLVPAGAPSLLIAFEYEPSSVGGPPFSVSAEEVRALHQHTHSVRELERIDILEREPRFKERGVTSIHEVAYALERNA
jgi:thiopurine S-methyltransferase